MARGRIYKMSAEVVDSNPYSRLMALQRMGIVKDYERIRDKTVHLLQSFTPLVLCEDASGSKRFDHSKSACIVVD